MAQATPHRHNKMTPNILRSLVFRLRGARFTINPHAIHIGRGTKLHKLWVLAAVYDNGSQGRITIGVNCAINYDFHCTAASSVVIGDNVLIAPRVHITDCDHVVDETKPTTKRNDFKASPVVVEHNCWIGVGAIILKGVQLGHHSIVGAGSVVTKSFPPYSIIAGNPAKRIGTSEIL
jgi:acetyltransferase-like isoleucine patch superfamily enzyme